MAKLSLGEALGREGAQWLNRKEASIFLCEIGCPVSVGTLAQLAMNDNAGKGPAFTRTRKRIVRYQRSDLRTWAAKQSERVE